MQIYVPQILIPKFVEAKDPVSASTGVSGHFQFILKRYGVEVFHGKSEDLILDVGLEKMAASAVEVRNLVKACFLGTGTTEPTSTDITLESIALNTKKFAVTEEKAASINDRFIRCRYEYGLSEAIGTWTEVGVSNMEDGSFLIDRSLIKDLQGNPVQIQKTAEDTLTIVFDLHFKRLSDTPTTSIVNVSGIGDVEVQTIVLNTGLQAMVYGGMGITLHSTAYMNKSRLGQGTATLLPTQEGCQNPINVDASLANAVGYTTGAKYREYILEWPASLVGAISEASIIMGNSGSYFYPPVFAMRFMTPVVKNDTDKKIRLRPRVTFARAQ